MKANWIGAAMKWGMIISFTALLLLAVLVMIEIAVVPLDTLDTDETATVSYCDGLEASQE